MATGDYHHTALAVARGVGMLSPQAQVIIIQAEQESKPSSIPKTPLASEGHAATQSPQQMSPVLTMPAAWTMDKAPQLAGLGSSLITHHPHSVTDAAAADGKERQSSHPMAPHLPFLAKSTVGDGNERHGQLPGPNPPLTDDLWRVYGVEQQIVEHTAVDTSTVQMANETTSASEHLPWLLPSSRQSSRMRGEGTIYQGLVFDVDDGSVAPDKALQALTAIAQVGPSSVLLAWKS